MSLVTVSYPPSMTAEAVDGIAAILDGADVPAMLQEAEPRQGGAALDPETVIIAAAAGAYSTTLAKALANDTSSVIRKLAEFVAACVPAPGRGAPPGTTLEIRDRGMVFILPARLQGTGAAWHLAAALQRADLMIKDPATSSGIYQWDRSQEDWALA